LGTGSKQGRDVTEAAASIGTFSIAALGAYFEDDLFGICNLTADALISTTTTTTTTTTTSTTTTTEINGTRAPTTPSTSTTTTTTTTTPFPPSFLADFVAGAASNRTEAYCYLAVNRRPFELALAEYLRTALVSKIGDFTNAFSELDLTAIAVKYSGTTGEATIYFTPIVTAPAGTKSNWNINSLKTFFPAFSALVSDALYNLLARTDVAEFIIPADTRGDTGMVKQEYNNWGGWHPEVLVYEYRDTNPPLYIPTRGTNGKYTFITNTHYIFDVYKGEQIRAKQQTFDAVFQEELDAQFRGIVQVLTSTAVYEGPQHTGASPGTGNRRDPANLSIKIAVSATNWLAFYSPVLSDRSAFRRNVNIAFSHAVARFNVAENQAAVIAAEAMVASLTPTLAASESTPAPFPVVVVAALAGGGLLLIVIIILIIVLRRRGPERTHREKPLKTQTTDRTVVAFENPMYDDPTTNPTATYEAPAEEDEGLYDEPAFNASEKANPMYQSNENIAEAIDEEGGGYLDVAPEDSVGDAAEEEEEEEETGGYLNMTETANDE